MFVRGFHMCWMRSRDYIASAMPFDLKQGFTASQATVRREQERGAPLVAYSPLSKGTELDQVTVSAFPGSKWYRSAMS